MSDHILRVIERLPLGAFFDAEHHGWLGSCPAHANSNADFFFRAQKDGKLLLRCKLGCPSRDIERALALEPHDLYPTPTLVTDVELAPLYSEDAEEAVVSALLMDPAVLADLDGLDASMFYLKPCRIVYTALQAIIGRGDTPDPLVLIEELGASLEEAGGRVYVGHLLDVVPSSANVVHYATVVADYAQKRELAASLDRYSASLKAGLVTPAAASTRLRGACDAILLAGTEVNEGARSMSAILADPHAMQEPREVAARLAWRGRCVLFSAREKMGKGLLMTHAAACVSSGRHFLGERTIRGPVLLLALEEAEGDVVRRLQRFGADEHMVFVRPRLGGVNAGAREAALRREIRKVRPVMTIVDTLTAYGEGIVTDENDAAAMQPLVQALSRLAHEEDTAMVIVHHHSKSGNYRGSTAIAAAVDGVMEMVEGPDPRTRRVHSKGRFDMRHYSCRLNDDNAGYSLV